MILNSIASSTSTSFLPNISAYPTPLKIFTLAELGKAAHDFNASRKVGEAGFGCVYHGILDDGSDVAVKLLKGVDQDRDKEHEFISEVEILSRLHHRNLVKLIGVCIEDDTHCLVYELFRMGALNLIFTLRNVFDPKRFFKKRDSTKTFLNYFQASHV